MFSIKTAAPSDEADFSNSRRAADIACKCSSASILKAARSVFMNASSCSGMAISPKTLGGRLCLVPAHRLLQFLTEVLEIVSGRFQLLGADDILGTGLFDVLHRRGHLIDSHQLLLTRRGDLR